ncbi:MAG: hypothetical protein MI865_08765 [Proteobacteria bacterium]|nr:hypothetical protein [Pseudomonadota bacterium]
MAELVLSLIVWIGANSDYDINFPQPIVVMTTQHNMCQLFGIDDKFRCEISGLKGFYNEDMTIYLGTDFDQDNSHHVSRLLHELVHYVQYKNGIGDTTCRGNLEVEAYDLQDTWRKDKGLEPVLADFNRLMLQANCSA